MQFVYADNNGATPIAEEVIQEMEPVFHDLYASPSSVHFLGRMAAAKLEEARTRIASLLSADSAEILFTSGGTESNHLAILGSLDCLAPKWHIVTSVVEHPSVKNLCDRLERQGAEVSRIGVDEDGLPNMDELHRAFRPNTSLVSVSAANHETGVIWPLAELGKAVRERGALLHVDAALAPNWLPLRPGRDGIDLLTISGHKLHGPSGTGALYVRQGVRLAPLFHGGRQEKGLRPGSENLSGIVGLGKAAELAVDRRNERVRKVKALRDRFELELIRTVPQCIRNGHPAQRLPNTSNLSFAYTDGEAILLSLSRAAICASASSACTTGTVEPSYVLGAMGLPDYLAHGAIRFSFSAMTTDEEIDYLLATVPAVIENLRQLSPFWQKQKKTPAHH